MENLDLLQLKIDKAKNALPEKTRRAIDSVDWKNIILEMRTKKGYSFEQIESLGLEVELLLSGLVNPEQFPKEIESRLAIPKGKADELVNELNELIFKKIREKMMGDENVVKTENKPTPISIKTEFKPMPEIHTMPKMPPVQAFKIEKKETEVLGNAGIQIVPKIEEIKRGMVIEKREDLLAKMEKPELISKEIETQKIMPSISSAKLSGSFQIPTVKTEYSLNKLSPTVDPYREIPK